MFAISESDKDDNNDCRVNENIVFETYFQTNKQTNKHIIETEPTQAFSQSIINMNS
jgi:hypothetical protein